MTRKVRFTGDKTLALLSSAGKLATMLKDMPKQGSFGENAEVVIGMEAGAMDIMGELFLALYLYAFADGDIEVSSARKVLESKYSEGTYDKENAEKGLALFDRMVAATQEIADDRSRKVPMTEVIQKLYAAHSSVVTTTRTVTTVKVDGTETTESENVIPFNRTTH